MATDYSSGLGDDREFLIASQPDDPEMRESVNVWVWDDGVEFGMPRFGIEAVADQWDTHDIQLNFAFADGRVLNIFEPGARHDRAGSDGKPRVLGAGPLSFELVEPFRRWRVRLDGMATATTVQAQMAGSPRGEGAGEKVHVVLDMEIESAAPAWENGALLPEAARVLETQEEGALMGGPRFEQLFRVTGTLRVDGDTHELRGGGLRIRREGIRRLAAFRGHVWQSAIFPSGRGFGSLTYPQREDGKATYNEAYLFEGDGQLVPAWVVEAPWLRTLQASGENVPVVLATEQGTTTIEGETILSTFSAMGPAVGTGLHLQQAIARYSWDGETANGMLERSSLSDQLS